jgi:hypothetical protein
MPEFLHEINVMIGKSASIRLHKPGIKHSRIKIIHISHADTAIVLKRLEENRLVATIFTRPTLPRPTLPLLPLAVGALVFLPESFLA